MIILLKYIFKKLKILLVYIAERDAHTCEALVSEEAQVLRKVGGANVSNF